MPSHDLLHFVQHMPRQNVSFDFVLTSTNWHLAKCSAFLHLQQRLLCLLPHIVGFDSLRIIAAVMSPPLVQIVLHDAPEFLDGIEIGP